MHDQDGLAVQGHDDGVRQKLGARSCTERRSQQEIPVAVHDETRDPLDRQRANGIERLRLAGIRRIVAHPGLE